MLVKVIYSEMFDDFQNRADVTVWIPETDSRKELERRAREAAKTFLQRALSAHDA